MTRDEVIKQLGEGATEEQIKWFLDKFHEKDNSARSQATELAKAQADLAKANADLAAMQGQIDQINRDKMTAQEKIEADLKEAAKIKSESQKVYAKAKATEILATVNINDEKLIESLVSDDVDRTIANATIYAENIKNVRESAEKQTREQLSTADLKPNASNSSNNDGMTWEKFTSLSEAEQNKFEQEHPEEFSKL